MAIYHLNVGFVSRSTGRSAVQSAAYITGEKLYESRRDLVANYKNRDHDILFKDTLTPDYVSYKFKDLTVWDLLESFEDEYAVSRFPHNLEAREKYLNSAQTAQTVVVALPKELPQQDSKELVEEFANQRFVSRGLIVTYAIHDDEGNPHAHLQISRRAVNEKGEIAWTKDRDICTRKALLETRKLWADLTNKYLERAGLETRITEKSFLDLGVNLEATKHRGWYSDKLKEKGIDSRIVLENQEVFAKNKQAIIDNPSIILNELTHTNATFSQMNLLKALQKRLGEDDKIIAKAFETALNQAVVVGESLDGQIRYTSQNMQKLEENALKALDIQSTQSYQQNLQHNIIEQIFKNQQELAQKDPTQHSYSKQQQEAILGLTKKDGLACLIGRAGSGKTTILKAVAKAYQDAGHTVIGTSLSAMAAQNLGDDAKITSHTLESWLFRWDKYEQAKAKFLSFESIMEESLFKQLDWYKDLKTFEKYQLTQNHVLIVDEAGMIGTKSWGKILDYVNKAGAKLIAVGDDNQFKAIESGDFFRSLKEKAFDKDCLFTLDEIFRQKTAWMRDASKALAELDTQKALSMYEQKGHIVTSDEANLANDIAKLYVDKIKHGENGLALTFTNQETRQLNEAIRTQLKQEGLLKDTDLITINGQNFTIGDKIVFLENNKSDLEVTDKNGKVVKNQFIKNGTIGVIKSINSDKSIKIALKINSINNHQDNYYTSIKTINNIDSNDGKLKDNKTKYIYDKISHGYAVTTHKSQGQTVDFTIVAASKFINATGLYVAMTRHRHDVKLFYAKQDFKDFKALATSLSRFEHKDLIKDYTILPENEQAWQRVQEYRLCILDAANVLRQTKGKEIDWQAYHQIKQAQLNLGKEILQDFASHQLYVQQAGLSQEMLEINTNQKARPLSLLEEKAKLSVQIYGETSRLTRTIWNEIKGKTHQDPSKHQQFQELRNERDQLAKEILNNYAIHREFVNFYTKEYGISKKSLENQVNKSQISGARSKIKEQSNHNLSFTKNPEPGTRHLEPSLIVQNLNHKIKDLSLHLLGKPSKQSFKEWRYGNKGSIAIQVEGMKQGVYANFETGEAGNSIKLISDCLQIDRKEAFKWGAAWLGYGNLDTRITSVKPQVKENHKNYLKPGAKNLEQVWIPTYPIAVQFPNLKHNPNLCYMLRGREVVDVYTYSDYDSNPIGYVVRLQDKNGHKITPTLTYCKSETGGFSWRWQGFGDNRPLYGLDQLKIKPDATVLVVEGEKTCEAAKKIFPEYSVLTWNGGCGSVHKSDWQALKDKQVIIWPDNDKPGFNAAQKITDILQQHGNENVKTVDVPSTLPNKWDLADKIPDGVDVKQILQISKEFDRQTNGLEHTQENLLGYGFDISLQNIKDITKGYYLDYLFEKKDEAFATIMANKIYQESKSWHKLIGKEFEDEKHLKICALAGFYTAWAKENFETFKNETNILEKSEITGILAAKSKINGQKAWNESDLLTKAMGIARSYEQEVLQQAQQIVTQNNNVNPKIHAVLLNCKIQCGVMTGFAMNKDIEAKFINDFKDNLHNAKVDQNCTKDLQMITSFTRDQNTNYRKLEDSGKHSKAQFDLALKLYKHQFDYKSQQISQSLKDGLNQQKVQTLNQRNFDHERSL